MSTEIQKNQTFEKEIADDGSLKFQSTSFNTPFGEKPEELPVIPGKYRLIWNPTCPFAHRAVIVRKLLGLENAISLGYTGPFRTKRGWEFTEYPNGTDPVLGIQFLEEAYLNADPNYDKRPTVPAIVDIETKTLVNNNHHRLTNELETKWTKHQKADAPNLYPEELRNEIDRLNDLLYEEINAGVYKCGFAESQEAYEKAYNILFSRLDWLEDRLSKQKYLFGNQITDADIRLFTTLVRFDSVYNPLFKCNRNRLVDYSNLWDYTKDLYQTQGFGDTTDFQFIKTSYYGSPHLAKMFNEYRIIPLGPDETIWKQPHNRHRFNKKN